MKTTPLFDNKTAAQDATVALHGKRHSEVRPPFVGAATKSPKTKTNFAKRKSFAVPAAALCNLALAFFAQVAFARGSLTPPHGPPAPAMKSLDQIEARTPIGTAPFTITNSGSYYLTTNLTGSPNADGITIKASNVNLDLNGFTLFGLTNSFSAVAMDYGVTNVTVVNGNLVGWGLAGVDGGLAANAHYERLRVSRNKNIGMSVGPNCSVRDCTIESNGSFGLFTGESCVISGCIARDNEAYGLVCGWGCTVVSSSFCYNHSYGILADTGANSPCGRPVRYNLGALISLGHCAATTGCPSENNEGDGIARDTQSLVLDDNVSDRHTQTAGEGISVGGSGNLPWTTCGFVPGFVFPTPAPLP